MTPIARPNHVPGRFRPSRSGCNPRLRSTLRSGSTTEDGPVRWAWVVRPPLRVIYFRLLILFLTAGVVSSCCSRRSASSDQGTRTLANVLTQIVAAAVSSAMESSDLSAQLQEFYRQHDRWPTNGTEFAESANVQGATNALPSARLQRAFAGVGIPQGTTNSTTRLGEFIFTPLSDGGLEASFARTTIVSRLVVEKPHQP